jgi:hypothetical protein
MADVREVRLFAEDVAHRQFFEALVRRIARECGVGVEVRTANARGGHGRVCAELIGYQRAIARMGDAVADLLLAAVDANCDGWDGARKKVAAEILPGSAVAAVVACPDPHIERWYLADPASLASALGLRVRPEARKCERDRYKVQLVDALRAAGHPVLLGGTEFAEEIVDAMDLYRAGKAEPSLGHCVGEIRGIMMGWAQ